MDKRSLMQRLFIVSILVAVVSQLAFFAEVAGQATPTIPLEAPTVLESTLNETANDADPALVALDNGFAPALKSIAAGAIESNHQLFLGGKNADLVQELPASNRLMTLLIAAETLASDTLIKIPAAALATDLSAQTPDGVTLVAGESYTARYLQLQLFHFNHKVAALALAEHISGSADSFIHKMNQRGKMLGLVATTFISPSGLPLEHQTETNLTKATSTIKDVLLLASACQSNSTIWKMMSERIVYPSLDGKFVIKLEAPTSEIFALSEGDVKGIYHFSNDTGATTICFASKGELALTSVVTSAEVSLLTDDSLSFLQQLDKHYATATLAEANKTYAGQTDTLDDGTEFNLIFKKNITYIHPKDDSFLQGAARYESFGPHHRPLSEITPVGRMVFTLKNGHVITANVFADKDYSLHGSFKGMFFAVLEQHQNILQIIAILLVLLLLTVLVLLIKTAQALFLISKEIKLNRDL